MADPKQVYSTSIRFKGKIDFQGLYELINKFFKNNEYSAKEKKYSQKDSGGKYAISWKVEADRKSTVDFKSIIEVEVNLFSIEKISSIPGQKGESEGKLEISIVGKSQYDYSNRFKEGMKEKLASVYKFVKQPGDKSAVKDSMSLDKEIRKFLNMNFDNE